MALARRAARAALAASFISGGIDQIRNPQPKAGPASPIAKPIADRIPQLPNDPESLVKLDGAIKVVGGLGLVFGPFARPAALLLAGSLVPTTLAAHRFWETTDPDQKASDKVEFYKNVSLVGGLLVTALDTGGRPSIPWVANKAAHGAAEAVGDAAGSVGDAVSGAAGAVAGAAGVVGGSLKSSSPSLSKRTRKALAKAEKRSAALYAVAEKQSAKALAKAEKRGGKAWGQAQEAAGSALGVAQAKLSDAQDSDLSKRAQKKASRALASAQDSASDLSKRAQKQGARALASAQDSASDLSKRAQKKAAKTDAKAQARSARDFARDRGPLVADAAKTAANATKEGALTAKDGVLAAKDKVAAAVSR